MSRRVRATRPDPALYLPNKGLTNSERAAEQDMAAGGHEARMIRRQDGTTALGGVALRCYSDSRRVYAYLRWSDGSGETAERYIGDVSDNAERFSALRDAWNRVHADDPRGPTAALSPTT
jgi:DNA mismatch endonuclease, patch repair protein